MGRRRSRWALGLGALAVIGGLLALLAIPGSDEPVRTASPGDPTATGGVAPAARTSPVEPSVLRGVPEVIDTATLRLDGQVVRLFGVDWARGGNAEDLTQYIRGRETTCRQQEGSDRFRCTIEGHDLSRVVLFNGGGRAAQGATPELLDAESRARKEGIGVWQRS